MGLNTTIIGKFARIYLARKKLKEKYDALTQELSKMESGLIEHMMDQDEPVTKVSLRGGITVDIKNTLWAKIITDDKEKLIATLQEIGLGHITTSGANHMALSSYLRELDAKGEKIPPELEGLVEKNFVDTLRVRKI